MQRTPRTPPNNLSLITSVSESDVSKTILNEEDLLQSNITQRSKRRRFSDEDMSTQLDDFKTELINMVQNLIVSQNKKLEVLENHMKEVKSINFSIQTTNNDIEKATKFLSTQISSVEVKINKLETDSKQIGMYMATLEEKIDEIDKRSIKTCIEIRNIPKINKEHKSNLYDNMQSLLKTLQLPIEQSSLRDAYRMPSKSDKKNSTVIVEFTNTLLKAQFLTAAKKYNRDNATNQLAISHLGFEGVNQPIYISEHLTHKTRRLLFLARDFAKSYEYNYCWTTNGNVYLKKREGMAYILMKSEHQLNELKTSTK